MECESAEPFVRTVKVTGGNKVAVLTKPSVLSKATGDYLNPGEEHSVIARVVMARDGRVYLRLKKVTGWVSTRSRKDFTKQVLAGENDQPIEPLGTGTIKESQASRLLRHVDEQGADVKPAGEAGADQKLVGQAQSKREPVKFTALSMQSILGQPSFANAQVSSMAKVCTREVFLADAVCLNKADGRAYLRLADGRGWLSERTRQDYGKYGVTPSDMYAAEEYDAPAKDPHVRSRLQSSKKVIVIEKTAREAPPTTQGNAGGGVFAGDDASKSQGLAAFAATEPAVFRTDTELWPESLRPPRPLLPALRSALRRLSEFHGQKVREAVADAEEAEARANSYLRSHPQKLELQKYAESLRKEAAKADKEWVAAVEKELKGRGEKLASPVKSSRADLAGGRHHVAPAQVKGKRWYCAAVPGNVEGSRYLGPFRADAERAREDMKRVQSSLPTSRSAAEGSEKGAGKGSDAMSPPTKKARVSRGASRKVAVGSDEDD